ncbi:hypothetical protein BN1708_006654 [Verticillium longisporum]|uniref:Uncharacterized protein n=1 Tax=Verticillium longisporum TaxID=100787 RepID=A0A0G4MLF6_VERLO|nr:hypothetical protein BN1708_006654 [Verticillium longisporum]
MTANSLLIYLPRYVSPRERQLPIATHILLTFSRPSPSYHGRLQTIQPFRDLLDRRLRLLLPRHSLRLISLRLPPPVYLTNIVRGLRAVGEGIWDDPDWEVKANGNAGEGDGLVLGKEDSLKVLSASNTILALVLVGVLVLQVGQAYAERKEREEIEALDKKDKEAAAAGAAGKGGAANKKKQ